MEMVKLIVEALNKAPFNQNYNVITFDSLTPEELLQVLSNVLQEISDQPKVDIHFEDSEQMLSRIFNMLHILRYKPFADSTYTLQQNISRGDKNTIHMLLEWCLSNVETLKQRVYLARFLMKVEVPSDILGNSDIASLNMQYLQLVEEFKKVHKESVLAKNVNKISISELRSDGVTMEKEKEIVSNRIYNMKKKVDALPNSAQILQSCRNLRMEQDRKKEISWQLQEESVNVHQSEQRLFRLSQQFQEIQKRSIGISTQALMKKLEEEIYVTSYIVEQKLPRELNQQKKEKEILETIVYSMNVSQASNDLLSSKVQALSQQINKLVESRLTTNSNADDKTVIFRQQAAIIARKKDALAEKFSELKMQIQDVYSKLQYKQQKLEEIVGQSGTILKDEEQYQEYVNKVKTRNNIYKRYRNDIAALKAEFGVLSRTIDILRSKAEKLGVDLSNANSQPQKGYDESTENKSSDAWLALITQLTANIAALKAKLTPIIAQVRPLKEKLDNLSRRHEDKKKVYDRTNITLNTSLTKLVNEVNDLQSEYNENDLEKNTLLSNIHISEVNLTRAKDEFQAHMSKNNSTPLVRDQLTHKIAESEKVGRFLKEKQKQIRDTEKTAAYQKEAWGNIQLLLQLKMNHLCRERDELNSLMHMEKGAETLVLRQ